MQQVVKYEKYHKSYFQNKKLSLLLVHNKQTDSTDLAKITSQDSRHTF